MDNISLEVTKYIFQILITVSGAFLAAWLATKRYRSDKLWDKKETTYSELINALHQMKWPASQHIDADREQRKISDEESEKFWFDFKIARKNVCRIAESSSFTVSSDVLTAIGQLENELNTARNVNSWSEHIHLEYSAVDKCIKKIKKIGITDLGIKNF